MNIYRSLGARSVTLGSRNTSPPAVYEDGSCDEQTKIWAIKKLGFNYEGNVELISWVECDDRSNLCPHGLVLAGKRFYGSPEPKKPGLFRVEYARIDGRKFYSDPIQFPQLERTLVGCLDKSKSLFNQSIRCLVVCESNIHKNGDFEFEELRSSWLYKGKPVASVPTWFSHLGDKQPLFFQYC